VRVLAADAEPLYRAALAQAIGSRPELELVRAAGDGTELLAAIGTSRPDVAIVGATADGVGEQQVLSAVARGGLTTRVVVIASRPEPRQVYTALARGAAGYLTKDADAGELCDAVAAVARGATVVSARLQAGVADELSGRAPGNGSLMTPRESETLRLIAEGLSAPAIGDTLHLSTATVKTHLQHIYAKLGVSERAAAVAEAMRRGLLE
jgi:two-component system, NarL family, nitrate/nitrite response regulator NarL